jgi:hypothetical protein
MSSLNVGIDWLNPCEKCSTENEQTFHNDGNECA